MEQDTKLILARVEDLVRSVQKYHSPAATSFLDPAIQKRIISLLNNTQDIAYRKVGGYPSAERNMFLIYPLWMEPDQVGHPLSIITIEWDNRYYQVNHRDILGSIMGLGIKREKIGDIIVENHMAYIMVSEDITSYILHHLAKIGKAPISARLINEQGLKISEQKSKVINTSVPSMRLDCLASSGFGLSRSKILPLIKEGRVNVNWETVTKPDYQLEEGDMISFRGRGRVKVSEVCGTTKKNRLHVVLERFL